MSDVPIRDYVERIFDERQAALSVALQAQQQALNVASTALEIRLEKLNELRAEVIQDRASYLTRTEYEAKHDALELVVVALADRVDERMKALEAWRYRATGVILILVPLAGIIGAAVIKAFS